VALVHGIDGHSKIPNTCQSVQSSHSSKPSKPLIIPVVVQIQEIFNFVNNLSKPHEHEPISSLEESIGKMPPRLKKSSSQESRLRDQFRRKPDHLDEKTTYLLSLTYQLSNC